jgi:hypothetical protein
MVLSSPFIPSDFFIGKAHVFEVKILGQKVMEATAAMAFYMRKSRGFYIDSGVPDVL